MSKKGKAKNTVNKAKHTKLLNRKKAKLKLEKETRKQRLKEIIKQGQNKNTPSS
ncbi:MULTISPECIES: hypothetical protein [Zobellia]|uniref:hypothetical protein n=1 Tax=Zobellia TaxID=112040 RepID=UPI001BFF73EC|nr:MULTISPECIES: hypothetical protein [Zobellia]MBT9186857.1 hypothetical protein [Zobellia russellii]MBU2974792.1 hypothetical protein [Zobellia sp. B3R18]